MLQKQRGLPPGYVGAPNCDGCQEEDIQSHEYFYHCPSCQYDLCKVCALKQAGVLRVNNQGLIELRGHGCPLRYEPNGDRHEGNHYCNGPELMRDGSGC